MTASSIMTTGGGKPVGKTGASCCDEYMWRGQLYTCVLGCSTAAALWYWPQDASWGFGIGVTIAIRMHVQMSAACAVTLCDQVSVPGPKHTAYTTRCQHATL